MESISTLKPYIFVFVGAIRLFNGRNETNGNKKVISFFFILYIHLVCLNRPLRARLELQR